MLSTLKRFESLAQMLKQLRLLLACLGGNPIVTLALNEMDRPTFAGR
jgi:hypothetical protein